MKTTKRTLLCIILSWFMIFGGTITPITNIHAETTVLVTRTGSRYHTHKCGNGTYYESTLSAARARGLTPCQKCYGSGYTSSSSTNNNSGTSSNTSNNNPVPKPKKISINTNSIELVKGETKKLSVKNTSGSVKWTSSNNSVAIVSNGTVKAKGKGTASITVSSNGQTKICKVKVEDPQISNDKLNIKIDNGRYLKIAGCSHDVVWKSSNDNIVDVNNDGYIFGNAPGSATITGKVHGRKYKCKVTVTLPKISEIEILDPVETVNINTYFTLEVTTDNDEIFEFSDINAKSSDDSIISISLTEEGRIELESQNRTGIATITIVIGGIKTSCNIEVIDNTSMSDYN